MKQTLMTYQIVDALYRNKDNGFSYEGAKALADYLDRLEEDIGEEMELDVVAIRCEYTEYKNYQELNDEYNLIDFDKEYQDDDLDDDDKDDLIKAEVENNTSVIEFDGGIIIQNY
jgi:hypothetical protein